jgi:hypothetical protein
MAFLAYECAVIVAWLPYFWLAELASLPVIVEGDHLAFWAFVFVHISLAFRSVLACNDSALAAFVVRIEVFLVA